MANRSLNVLITGAGSGLGRDLSILLSRSGHRIFVTDQHVASARETLALIEQSQRCSAHQLDVTDETSIRDLFRELADERVDLLINNAGLQHMACVEQFPQDQWDCLIGVMLTGVCRMTQAVLPGMRQRGFGRIINIGSIHSLVASAFKAAYVAAKHAVVGFSKVVALETADVEITINTICPSYIRTPLVDTQIASQARAHGVAEQEVIDRIMLKPMPKGRFITGEEVAATVEFLASDLARNITGQCIVIDGGWTIQ